MCTGKVCESCLMNLLEHTEDMTELRDGRQNSLQLQPSTSPFSAAPLNPGVVVFPGYF